MGESPRLSRTSMSTAEEERLQSGHTTFHGGALQCIPPNWRPRRDSASTEDMEGISDATRTSLANPYLVLALVCFVGNMINGTFTLIVLALPLLSDEFKVDESIIVWVMFAPMLVAGMLSTPLGRASDLFGRKRMWFIGTSFHLASMVACGLAPSVEVLLAARVLTGLGWATEGPAGSAMALSVFPKSRRGYVISIFTIFGTLSSSMGMIIGGFLLRAVSWRILFLGNAPIVALAVPFGRCLLPDCNDPRKGIPEDDEDEESKTDPPKESALKPVSAQDDDTTRGSSSKPEPKKKTMANFDWLGALLLSATFGIFLTGLNRAGPWGWSSPMVQGMLIVGVLAMG